MRDGVEQTHRSPGVGIPCRSAVLRGTDHGNSRHRDVKTVGTKHKLSDGRPGKTQRDFLGLIADMSLFIFVTLPGTHCGGRSGALAFGPQPRDRDKVGYKRNLVKGI